MEQENKEVSVLARNALLVRLVIHQWSGVKQDQKARETVETTHKTEMRVGNYQKHLLPKCKELKAIQNVAQNIRMFFDRKTLPWYADGTGMLASNLYMDFAQEFQKRRMEYEKAVQEFLNNYDSLKARAQMSLGDLYNEGDYPTVAQLQYSFSCEVTYMPVPDVTDFRVELPEAERNKFMNQMKDAEANARLDVYQRLTKVIKKAAETLGEPDAIFRDSLINNINELLNLVPALNVTEDQDLEKLRAEVYSYTSTISPDVCRGVNTVREETAKKLNEIADRMGMFMGVAG